MKKIVWLTGDYFIDVDMSVVPELKMTNDIKWFVIRTKKSTREVNVPSVDGIVTVGHKSISPLTIIDYWKLIKKIKKMVPDLLFVDYIGMPYFFVLLAKMFDMRKVIFLAHNVAPRPTWNKLDRWYVPYIFRHIFNLCVPSTHNIPYIQQNYPHINFAYIPMTVKSFGSPKVKKGEDGIIKFLFFGHVMSNKKLDHLILAYKALNDSDKKKSEIVVYGKCAEQDKFINLADGEENIHLHFEYVPNEMIADIFTTSSYLVLPYDNVDQSGPGMIALNYNLPIICTDLVGFRQIVNDGEDGFLYEKNNIKSLTSVLHKCIGLHDDQYQLLKKNQATFVNDNFTIEVVAKKYQEMFNKVLNNA